jgi:hypothetical protein
MKFANLFRRALIGAALSAVFATAAIAQGSFPGSGPQPVTRGGTGLATLPQNNLIFGNGTAPVGFIAPGINGRCLFDNGSIWTPGFCILSTGAAATGTTGHAVPFLDGTNTFSVLQTVSANAGTLPAAQIGAILRAAQVDGMATRLELDSFGGASLYSCVRADGTSASPSALQAGDEICSINSFGSAASGTVVGPSAALRSYAAEIWTPGHQGTYWRFGTTPIGGTTLTDRLGVENDGGITAPPTVAGGSRGAGTFNAANGYFVGGTQLEDIFALSGSFTLPSGQLTLQPASAGMLGGVNSIASLAHNWIAWIDTAGLPHQAQPGFGDLSGSLAPSQCPAGTAGAIGCLQGDNATLSIASGVIGLNLGHANTWTAAQAFPNNSLTLAEFPTFAANTVLGSISGGTPSELSQAQLTLLINLATATLPGAVPAWPNNTSTFFRGDGNYASLTFANLPPIGADSVLGNPTAGSATVQGVALNNCSNALTYSTSTHTFGCNTTAGTGTVTSIATGAGLSGGPITASGTIALSAARQTNPTHCQMISTTATTCNSGGSQANNGTYTTPANVLWIEVTLVGGGGGGSGGNNGGAGTAGNSTCWATTGAACTSPVYQAGGGAGAAASGGGGSLGGIVSGSATCDWSVPGGSGGAAVQTSAASNVPGGTGGNSSRGGGGGSQWAAENNGAANSGGGGSGGSGNSSASSFGGGGGGGGATCHFTISNPAATYTYAVAGTAAGGSGGGGAFPGGGGAAGQIIIYEHYGS